jgi:hypothetical protein
MTKEKVIDVLDLYIKTLKAREFKANRCGLPLDHVLWMCFETATFVHQDRMDKAFRWLGFIQGVLWCTDVFSIDEMKSHNRPTLLEEV